MDAVSEVGRARSKPRQSPLELVRQATIGFWNNIYKGPFGRLAGGLQYSFTQKFGFAGYGGPTARLAFAGSPERNANTFLTSLRYYPF
jgi:hypothetical protein